jgi:ADP-L-glycero-D-manno-heptose 6-epimerase
LALKAKKNAIVNIGSGQTISFNEIIEVLNKIFSLNLEPQYIENPYVGSYQEYTQADLTLANSVLGYTPIWKFDEAVKDYMQMVGFKDS